MTGTAQPLADPTRRGQRCRFITVQSQNDAPAFFCQTSRYDYRVYGGVVLNALQ